MQIICISRGSQSKGEQFAVELARKLGYECVGREQLLEEATRLKIPIGKLETAIIKPHIYSEGMALELEHYKALAASILCEKALKGNIVYHGRTGHLLLPGVDHIFRIRVEADMEYRIRHVMQQLNLPREKAKRYIEQVEEDRRKWVKMFYKVDWDVYSQYDLVLNLSQMSVPNAASAVCNMAQLPEFAASPASVNKIKDLYLASRARMALFRNEQTRGMNLKASVSNGAVHVTYLSQEVKNPEVLTEALRDLKDAREIVCTQAQSNILWIQEEYKTDDDAFKNVLELAGTWDAAIELIKLNPSEEALLAGDPAPAGAAGKQSETWRETGIIDESDASADPEDLVKVYEKLVNEGRAGGKKVIRGTQKTLLNAIDRSVNYRMIIFDNVFNAKGESLKKRMIREWSNFLADSLKKPVMSTSEIASQYHFGTKQLVKMLSFAGLTALISWGVFHFDKEILQFLVRKELQWRIVSTVGIFIFVPLFAKIYSTVTGLFLKMLKFD